MWYNLIDKCIDRKNIIENDIELLTKHIEFLKMINNDINNRKGFFLNYDSKNLYLKI